MDSAQHKGNLQKTLPQSNPKYLETPEGSSPKPLIFKHSPSPDRAYTGIKRNTSSLQKHIAEHPSSTVQYTPLGVSRSRLISARTP
jgi:hypothetical protein